MPEVMGSNLAWPKIKTTGRGVHLLTPICSLPRTLPTLAG